MFPAVSFADDRAGAVRRPVRRLLRPAAGRRVLPRHRRHRVRRRRPARQRLVPAGAARAARSASSGRHGRHRDQRAHDGEARRPATAARPVPAHRGVLAVYAVVAALVLRDAPGRARPERLVPDPHLAPTLRLPITWQSRVLYAVGFGGYVAFCVYLPDVPEDRLRPHPGRRRAADRRASWSSPW